MLFGREVELTEKIFGGLTAPDMKLINRSKIIDGYGIDGFAKGLDSGADCSSQVAMRVVIGYILLSWQWVHLLKKIKGSP